MSSQNNVLSQCQTDTFVDPLCFHHRLGACHNRTCIDRASQSNHHKARKGLLTFALTNHMNALKVELRWILATALHWRILTSWLLAVNSSICSLLWVAPSIFTLQKTSPHSCSQAAVTFGLLSGLCCLLHVSVSQLLRGEALYWGLQIRFWGGKAWDNADFASFLDLKCLTSEITQDLGCDVITIGLVLISIVWCRDETKGNWRQWIESADKQLCVYIPFNQQVAGPV